VTASILGGAHIVRVHDVAAMMPVVRVADAIRAADGR
jgi:dihydropteroate synthase